MSTDPTREGINFVEEESVAEGSCLYKATLIRYSSLSTGAEDGVWKRPTYKSQRKTNK